MKNNNVIIFDTTMRDGEQSPGASMNIREKLEIGRQLTKLGVDVMEAGFPISSPGDFESVKQLAQKINGPVIAGLARAHEKDITACWDAVKYAKRNRIHVFLATSDIHIKSKLNKTRDEVLAMAVKSVKYACSLCKDVEFSAEDATRTDFNYLCAVIEAVIAAGAKTVNIPDTVGYTLPDEYIRTIRGLRDRVKGIDKVIVSVHCHNDLGLAVANSLSAIAGGARQVECTINGIGERAGNAALEEVVMAMHTRHDLLNVECNINTKELYKTSRMVSTLTGVAVQPNKAIIGANAFAHEAGIHQDGVLKERTTYEIMDPKAVGVPSNKLVLGKHSGRHAFVRRLKDLGYIVKTEEIEKLFSQFKVLADKKKCVYDDDILSLVEAGIAQAPAVYVLEYLQTSSGTGVVPTATVRIACNAKKAKQPVITQEASTGDGPVDAAYKAIEKITGIRASLSDYTIRAVSGGEDAQGEVNVRADYKGNSYTGRGASTDIIEASVKAYLQAINKIASEK